MEWLIELGIGALLRVLDDKKQLPKWAPAFGKVFVKIERTATSNATLAAAIERARQKA